MIERIQIFLPSILILSSIAVITFIYLKWITKSFGDNFKSIEWHKKNAAKTTLLIGIPYVNVFAPVAEELIFRVPIIIIFSSLTLSAWYGILTSAIIFSLFHWFRKSVTLFDIFHEKGMGKVNSDDMETEISRITKEKEREMKARKVINIVLTVPLGIIAGYYGIEHQSIWVSVAIHSVWNLVVPIVASIIAIIIIIGVYSLRQK